MTSGLQPFLHDAVVALRAPTQAWSRRSADMQGGDSGEGAIDGLYHGDTRYVRRLRLTCDGAEHEVRALLPALRAAADWLTRHADSDGLAAAEGFAFRMPELHAGDARADTPTPVPYPAACRPQAWSAAAAIACREIVTTRPHG